MIEKITVNQKTKALTTNKKSSEIDNWSVLNLFMSYLKRNKAVVVSMFLLPLIFIMTLGFNYKNLLSDSNSNIILMIFILWLIQSASFAIQTFLTILLDFKQSIIYRRIGLTRIKKINFLFMASLFNIVLMILSNLFSFLIIIILLLAFKLTDAVTAIFNWKFILVILLTLVSLVFFTSISLLMSIFIKTRTGQTIAALIMNFVIIIPLFILIFFLNAIISTDNGLIDQIGISGILIIFFSSFIIINLISALLYYLSWKYFKWYD